MSAEKAAAGKDARSATRQADSSGVMRRDSSARRSPAHECIATRIGRRFSEQFFDAHQLVVFFDSFTTTRRAGLEMPGVERHGEIGDERIHRLAASMRHHRAPPRVIGQMDRRDGLRERADLVELDEDRARRILGDASCNSGYVRDKQVITHQFDLIAQFAVEDFPSIPVVLRKTILEHGNRVSAYPIPRAPVYRPRRSAAPGPR